MTENVVQSAPTWPTVRCSRCAYVYEYTPGPPTAVGDTGVLVSLPAAHCPRCGFDKFLTVMGGNANLDFQESQDSHESNESNEPLVFKLDRWRHRIPFWWWLTYDALVGLVIVAGVSVTDPMFWLGWAVLGIAIVIDTVEFIVKRPSARAKLNP